MEREGDLEREVGGKDMGEGEKRSGWIEKGMKLGERVGREGFGR
jgi:hypothetical protein